MHNQYPSNAAYPHLNAPTNLQNGQRYPQNQNSQPILVGVPVTSNQANPSLPNVYAGVPYNQPQMYQPGPVQYPVFNAPSMVSQPSAPQQTFSPTQPSHASKKGYVELSEVSKDDDYERLDRTREQNQSHHTILYPQATNQMINPEPQFRPIDAQMFGGAVVYDPALLYKVSSREPQLAHCQKCNKYVQTIVKYEAGTGTVVSAVGLALLGACPCAWIPFCIQDCKNALHFCPLCADKLGEVKFLVK